MLYTHGTQILSMMLIRYCMYSCALQDKNCDWKQNFAKNCGNGKRNRNPNHKSCIINFLLLLAYRDYVFPACGTTALLHTFLSIDQRMAVAFSIAYRNLYLNIPHKLIMIGTILICIVPGLILFMSWTFKHPSVYFDAYSPYCQDLRWGYRQCYIQS